LYGNDSSGAAFFGKGLGLFEAGNAKEHSARIENEVYFLIPFLKKPIAPVNLAALSCGRVHCSLEDGLLSPSHSFL
jgi:hypothetical protein